jgi:hypothetical protein
MMMVRGRSHPTGVGISGFFLGQERVDVLFEDRQATDHRDVIPAEGDRGGDLRGLVLLPPTEVIHLRLEVVDLVFGRIEPTADADQDLDQPLRGGKDEPTAEATEKNLEPRSTRRRLAACVIEGEMIHCVNLSLLRNMGRNDRVEAIYSAHL